MGTDTKGLFTKFLGHELQTADDLGTLTLDPAFALLFWRALGFEKGGCGGVADTVSQRFPALDFGPFAVGGGEEFVIWGDVVDVFDNDPGVEEGVSSSSTSTGILPSGLRLGTLLSTSQGESMTKSYSIFFSASTMRTFRANGLVWEPISFIICSLI